MKCQDIQDRLGLYLFDELDAVEQQAVEQHIEGCAQCRAECAQLRAVQQLLQEGLQHSAPAALSADRREMVQAHTQKLQAQEGDAWLNFPTWRWVGIGIAAVLLFSAALAALLFPRLTPPPLALRTPQLQDSGTVDAAPEPSRMRSEEIMTEGLRFESVGDRESAGAESATEMDRPVHASEEPAAFASASAAAERKTMHSPPAARRAEPAAANAAQMHQKAEQRQITASPVADIDDDAEKASTHFDMIRHWLQGKRQLPAAEILDSVKFVNAFDYDYPAAKIHPVSLHARLGPSLFAPTYLMQLVVTVNKNEIRAQPEFAGSLRLRVDFEQETVSRHRPIGQQLWLDVSRPAIFSIDPESLTEAATVFLIACDLHLAPQAQTNTKIAVATLSFVQPASQKAEVIEVEIRTETALVTDAVKEAPYFHLAASAWEYIQLLQGPWPPTIRQLQKVESAVADIMQELPADRKITQFRELLKASQEVISASE